MDNSLVEKLRPHWLPIVLGVLGVMFFVYGLIALSSHKSEKPFGSAQDKPDILFESASTQSEAGSASSEQDKKITIDIEGAVEKPGVYDLPADARIQDALIAAGGMSTAADRELVSKSLNLAAKLTDGAKIYIPLQGDTSAVAGLSTVSGGSTTFGSSGTININSASAKELDSLSGVGEVTAQKIISNRPYGSIDELLSKKIVGSKVFEQIKEKIVVY